MTFTDDDLKRLKEDNEKRRAYYQRVWDETKGTEREGSAMGAAHELRLASDIESLLARLEAAEKALMADSAQTRKFAEHEWRKSKR